MRLILNKSVRDHIPIEELTEKSGLPTLNQMIVEAVLMEMWQSVRFKLPVLDLFEPVIAVSYTHLTLPTNREV